MIPLRVLARMSLLARSRPSLTMFWVVIGAILLAVAIYGIEQLWGWPEALTVERARLRID